MIPPLCILQARYHSTRLPGKMLLPLGGETLIARGWRIACEAFGREHCVVACPFRDSDGPLADELERIRATRTWYDGPEEDVLSRMAYTALTYRWHPDSVIVRYTPDDPWKEPFALQRVAAGERLQVELGGEAFTLGQLVEASRTVGVDREHLTHALFVVPPPRVETLALYERGSGVLTIDTQEDYNACVAYLETHAER